MTAALRSVPAPIAEALADVRHGDGRAPRTAFAPDAFRSQLTDGHAFILDAPDHVPALWGRGEHVLWSEGEGLQLVGPQGIGKTTLMQQVALRRASAIDGELLGFPVRCDRERLTLYLALDRPKQIARSFRRMATEGMQLDRLKVWRGPLPLNPVTHPELLAEFIHEVGVVAGVPVGTVCIDSIKDVAAPLSSDEVGAAYNRAVGTLIAQDIEVVAAHHQRKAHADNKKPTTLDDVYGSRWITAGAGSVILLWGEPGDPIAELTHLKQPAGEVGPLEIAHDHQRGSTTRRDRLDTWAFLQSARCGVTAKDTATAIYGTATPAQIEKARRKLNVFVDDGFAERSDHEHSGHPTTYWVADVSLREGSREGVTPASRTLTIGSTEPHVPLTHPGRSGLPPTGVVDRDREREGDRTDAELQELIDFETRAVAQRGELA